MKHSGRVIHHAAGAGFVPRPVALSPLPRGQNHIELFGRVLVIGVTHSGRHETHTHDHVVSAFEPMRPGKHRIGMPVEEAFGAVSSVRTPFPAQFWSQILEGDSKV